MKIRLISLMAVILFNVSACDPNNPEIQVQAGDLLFYGVASENLSDAIDRVTRTSAETHFSHVGLVESVGERIWVLHASPDGGTCRVLLSGFLNPRGDSVEVVVYRLKGEWQNTIPEALESAVELLGKPYNFSYILTDSAHYCSEFVYQAFAADSVFELNPMTFKDPQTDDFYPTWISYYQRLGLEIPEGLPGCNPNGMAASEKLERIGVLKSNHLSHYLVIGN